MPNGPDQSGWEGRRALEQIQELFKRVEALEAQLDRLRKHLQQPK